MDINEAYAIAKGTETIHLCPTDWATINSKGGLHTVNGQMYEYKGREFFQFGMDWYSVDNAGKFFEVDYGFGDGGWL